MSNYATKLSHYLRKFRYGKWTKSDSIDLVQRIAKHNPTILDIGANDGQQSLWLASLFRDAKIFSFEPDPRAIEKFRQQVNKPNIFLQMIAIGATDGVTQFHMSSGFNPAVDAATKGDWDRSGSIKKPQEHLQYYPWCKFSKTCEVVLERLDTWASDKKLEEIDFIWADVQGAEDALIEGGKETLERTRFFYTEYSNIKLYENQISLRKILKRLPNFQILKQFQNDVLLKNKKLS